LSLQVMICREWPSMPSAWLIAAAAACAPLALSA